MATIRDITFRVLAGMVALLSFFSAAASVAFGLMAPGSWTQWLPILVAEVAFGSMLGAYALGFSRFFGMRFHDPKR